jgi:hypothetical protein
MLLVERECALGGLLFLGGAAATFVERLRPERLGDREAKQKCHRVELAEILEK